MTQSHPPRGTTRREVVGGLLGGIGIAAASPLRSGGSLLSGPGVTWSLVAAATTYTFGNGTTLPFFRLQHSGVGTTHGSIPLVEATEGQAVTLVVDNQLPIAVRPALVGVMDGPLIPPGQTRQFTFTMPPAGSYLVGQAEFREPGAGPLVTFDMTRPTSGFSAIAISRPASGTSVLYDGGPAYDHEYYLLYEDADDRWNAAMALSNRSRPRTPYEPNYFLVNGLSYPDVTSDPTTMISGSLGDRILIRMGNLGRMRQAIHFHGYHPEVVARNNVPETILGEKDTIGVPSRTTADVILTPDQVGTFPLHPHSLTAVTANGFYPMGQLTLITIT